MWLLTYRNWRYNILILFLLLSSFKISAQEIKTSYADSTSYYSFHNDYWINLHHFLYQKARGSQLNKLQEDGLEFLDIGESRIYKSLNKKDQHKLDLAIKYYTEHLIEKDLLRDLGDIRVWLQNQKNTILIRDTLFSEEYTSILNSASEVYSKTYWPIHKEHNQRVLQKHLEVIRSMESPVIPKMEKISLNKWPMNEKVRVDLTVYANYAGAYTPSRPKMNIFISTIDPRSLSLGFVETIFHEGSHLLFNYGGPWRGGITEVFESEKPQIDYPIHLWHASLFYLCGKICQEEFIKRGFDNYTITMIERNIFNQYHFDDFFFTLNAYYDDKITFSETIADLLKSIAELKKN
ncbi:hypothetical protein [Fulvivirga lutea]|uniref:Uncharacterized protein n=1 Tax=Fulvivirga lutea TaxID=2810512 RepID=A0A974WDM1_9BACT|nr:hypothetical protein [Fulvivirga lutea]QSE96164.1 hypothetical protein JR347_11125 [Fulvivirga lutea]